MGTALSGSRRNLAVAAALAALGLAAWLLFGPSGGAAGGGSANAAPAKPLDHFLCYRGAFKPATAVGASITLKDEFSAQPVAHKVGQPQWFCNPAEKDHPGVGTFPIIHPNNHLTAYGLDGRVPPRRLRVNNQFQKPPASGAPNLVTDPGTAAQPNHPLILVPTQKSPLPPPADINHFKCYKTKPVSIDQQVAVRDQWAGFGSGGQVTVQQAVLICNPAAKTHAGKTFPILHPNQHLVCYTITPFRFDPANAPGVQLRNQFGSPQFTPVVRFMLCVPSTKVIVH
jgi:hypothetical protein